MFKYTKLTKEKDLIEITDKVDLKAYLDEKDGERYVVLRITKNGFFDSAVDMGPIINSRIVKHFDKKGNLIDEEGNVLC